MQIDLSKIQDPALPDNRNWLRHLIEGIPQMIWRASRKGFWSWSSPQWAAFTGQTPSVSAGFGWLDAIHPDDRSSAEDAWERAASTGPLTVALRIRSGEGEYRWFQTRASPVYDYSGEISEWLGTSTDIDELRRMQTRQQFLLAELQHRTRNLIAVVQSIAQETARRSGSIEHFSARFDERLSALSRVQGLLAASGGKSVTIRYLIESELNAVAGDDCSQYISLNGPEVFLETSFIQIFTLALHELATNAVKYGHLLTGGSLLRVEWNEIIAQDGRLLSLDWEEIQSHSTPAQPCHGFGLVLLTEILPSQLDARTTWARTGSGIKFDLKVMS